MKRAILQSYVLRGWKAHLQGSVGDLCGFSNVAINAPSWVISKSEVSNMEIKTRTSMLLTLNILLGSLFVLFNDFFNDVCNDRFYPRLQSVLKVKNRIMCAIRFIVKPLWVFFKVCVGFCRKIGLHLKRSYLGPSLREKKQNQKYFQ